MSPLSRDCTRVMSPVVAFTAIGRPGAGGAGRDLPRTFAVDLSGCVQRHATSGGRSGRGAGALSSVVEPWSAACIRRESQGVSVPRGHQSRPKHGESPPPAAVRTRTGALQRVADARPETGGAGRQSDVHERLAAAMADLNPRAVEMLVLRYTEDYSDADIARRGGGDAVPRTRAPQEVVARRAGRKDILVRSADAGEAGRRHQANRGLQIFSPL